MDAYVHQLPVEREVHAYDREYSQESDFHIFFEGQILFLKEIQFAGHA